MLNGLMEMYLHIVTGKLENAALQALADTAGISSASYEAARADARERANIALGQRSELLRMFPSHDIREDFIYRHD